MFLTRGEHEEGTHMTQRDHPEVVRFESGTVTQTGKRPWEEPERDNWYGFDVEHPTGWAKGWVKRTAHAAALGRALFAGYEKRGIIDVVAVRVFERDTYERDDLDEMPESAPLAVVTDSAPVPLSVARVERDLEALAIALRRSDEAQDRVDGSMRAANRLPEGDPDWLDAGRLVVMAESVMTPEHVMAVVEMGPAKRTAGD